MEHVLILLLVVAAAAYLGWAGWRTFARRGEDGSCGCGTSDCSAKSEIQRRLKKAARANRVD